MRVFIVALSVCAAMQARTADAGNVRISSHQLVRAVMPGRQVKAVAGIDAASVGVTGISEYMFAADGALIFLGDTPACGLLLGRVDPLSKSVAPLRAFTEQERNKVAGAGADIASFDHQAAKGRMSTRVVLILTRGNKGSPRRARERSSLYWASPR
jgi:hypothetical protein